jgi:hypothetical protein
VQLTHKGSKTSGTGNELKFAPLSELHCITQLTQNLSTLQARKTLKRRRRGGRDCMGVEQCTCSVKPGNTLEFRFLPLTERENALRLQFSDALNLLSSCFHSSFLFQMRYSFHDRKHPLTPIADSGYAVTAKVLRRSNFRWKPSVQICL